MIIVRALGVDPDDPAAIMAIERCQPALDATMQQIDADAESQDAVAADSGNRPYGNHTAPSIPS